jgi:hypothetical protein
MRDDELRDEPPRDERVTAYDRAHLQAYVRLLDADAAQADWREAAALILGLDVQAEPARARRVHDAHLARARWMSTIGYREMVHRPARR